MLISPWITTTYAGKAHVPGFTCELLYLHWPAKEPLETVLRVFYSHPSPLSEEVHVAVFKGFLHVCCLMALRLSGLRGCRPDKTVRRHPATTTTYALRCSSIDLIWPMARVGFSPLGHTLTQFMMLWQRNTLKASLKPSRRLSVSVSRLSIRKR